MLFRSTSSPDGARMYGPNGEKRWLCAPEDRADRLIFTPGRFIDKKTVLLAGLRTAGGESFLALLAADGGEIAAKELGQGYQSLDTVRNFDRWERDLILLYGGESAALYDGGLNEEYAVPAGGRCFHADLTGCGTEDILVCDGERVAIFGSSEKDLSRRAAFPLWHPRRLAAVSVCAGGMFELSALSNEKALPVRRTARKGDGPAIFLVGDSTVCDQPDRPWFGWGQVLPELFMSGVDIFNYALSGRACKSFIWENHYAEMRRRWRAGDYVFFQFGHNDQKPINNSYADAFGQYAELLRFFVDEAMRAGLTPVVVSPMERRAFDRKGKIIDSHGEYPEACRRVAEEKGVMYIDLAADSKKLYESYGEERSKALFVHEGPGVLESFPKGIEDNTHFRYPGAKEIAHIICRHVRERLPELAERLLPLRYELDCRTEVKKISPPLERFGGSNPLGETLGVNNYFFLKDGRPFYAVSGEIHYARLAPERWEDAIVKMKLGGVNIISTYIFWIHHEETEGRFDWSGRRSLAEFVRLCEKHGMYVIIRIGPFCHGECRNGGLPDWLYGRPFDLRSNDERYLFYVERLYGEIARQVEGLLYRNGGPIIGTQIENEYMHAGAPWSLASGDAMEWATAGRDGAEHMRRLLEIAKTRGIMTPFYTGTAWGGGAAPDDVMLPLWGGYAYWPWIFYDPAVKTHPATPEYIFRDYHSDGKPSCYNFDPLYRPENLPYSCCEMGGGMTCFYRYRFELDPSSVSAMAVVKMAGGCNFLGYYMYHGGTNPTGFTALYLNEPALPKRSYDFQTCVGEFGQIREQYRSLKLLHYFAQDFAHLLCGAKTVLPDGGDTLDPRDMSAFRYAARVSGNSGFLFLCNFQDHIERHGREHVDIALSLPGGPLVFEDVSIAGGMSAVFPFNLWLGGLVLRRATAQLVTKIYHDGTEYYFFAQLEGSGAVFYFDGGAEITDETDGASYTGKFTANPGNMAVLRLSGEEHIRLCVLTAAQARNFYKASVAGRDRAILCGGALLVREDRLFAETTASGVYMQVFPHDGLFDGPGTPGDGGLFRAYSGSVPERAPACGIKIHGGARAELSFEPEDFDGVKELLLRVMYEGDVGCAFIDGVIVSDNFCNGAPWEIGLAEHRETLVEKGMYINVTPVRTASGIVSNTPMAGVSDSGEGAHSKILSIEVVPVYEIGF